MAYHQITDNIWIGSVMALRADKSLVSAGVTHILSVFGPDSGIAENETTMPLLGKVEKHKRLQVEDMENVNLLEHFQETNLFIEDAVSQNKGVLVHCIAGISRSVTCVVAYLMKTNKWDAHEAIEFVRSKRPIACPNTGFREQLETYYKCGYQISETSKPYREFLLTQNARMKTPQTPVYTKVEMPPMTVVWKQVVPGLLRRSGYEVAEASVVNVNGQAFGVMESVADTMQRTGPIVDISINNHSIDPSVLNEMLDKLVMQGTRYRCKQCSTVLASSASLRNHQPGSRDRCQDYFFEPVEWMRSELDKGELEGRLVCPKCMHKVGSYNWAGTPCSCAVWVTPTFKLGAAKVDKMVYTAKAHV